MRSWVSQPSEELLLLDPREVVRAAWRFVIAFTPDRV